MATVREIDPDVAWRVHPQVSIRPESFGALLYHFGTRKLSFLKDRTLLAVVQALDGAPTAGRACADAGVAQQDRQTYLGALGALAASQMIEEVPA